jgi:hypothetical protein
MAMATPQAAVFDKVLAPDKAETLARIEMLAHVMDSALVVPGTRIRLGLDSIVGLVPGIGDLASALVSSYIVWEARRLGLPRWKVARMVANIAVDTTIGAIPLVGDVMDVFFKSNRRNLKILRDHLDKDAGRGIIDADYRVVQTGR